MTFAKRIKFLIKNPSQRQLAASAGVLLFLLALIGMSLFILFNDSMGWFASNREAKITGGQLSAAAKTVRVSLYTADMQYVGDLTSGTDIPFDLDIPGSSVTFVLRIENLTTDLSVTVDRVLFPAPSNTEEVPKIVTESNVTTSHYFSTQLAVRAELLNPASTLPTSQEVASAFSTAGDGSLLTPASLPADFVLLNTSLNIAPNGSEFIAVKVTFRNLQEDQSVFCDFGKDANGQNPAPCCKRHVFVLFS